MPPPDGILNVLKPVGMTSHDVVDAVRRLAGTRRVGHTGTLDPGASGVLVLVVGRATRLAEFVAVTDKEYLVEVTFGRATDTGDAYGATVAEHPTEGLTAERVREVLRSFMGEIEQVPPMASAVHVGGRRLYELRREGARVDVPPRRVTIYQLELVEFAAERPARGRLHITCSKGTYIRGLCHEIGTALGVGAHASFMVRTRVGRYLLEDAYALEELTPRSLEDALESPEAALADLPAVELTAVQRQAVVHGQPVPLFKVPGWQRLVQADLVRLRDARGLVALARVEQGVLKPFKVLREG
ncbi:MAG: tRNA pseudouridine(55) synthase TruB [Armatimonadota bacterium]|nr:tRNA pseudouridine(55) synthase TruB [Armatimonadota bacterium]MDR7452791.1 tRNA pseudouridine(55) synthase TruB [Armatimonadota bacterium]MDR7466570.1 tRNA pseudouridine(55) synthase TruB [Armatimonadota bacterium]MDR7495108.1 tRNA pseudouridine(55) synthase TruB [Armatimonadota bacterium]MDR7500182.1 tRNA pseudouridine(55) synthase TruB [Armatimonadota bacterium]